MEKETNPVTETANGENVLIDTLQQGSEQKTDEMHTQENVTNPTPPSLRSAGTDISINPFMTGFINALNDY